MLPSQARKAMVDHFLAQLIAGGVDYRARPKYRLADAYDDARQSTEYAWKLVADCFEEAEKQFDREHPMCWDNEKQQAYRAGLPRA